MGSIFREPGNIIHKIEDVLIESLLLEADRGLHARDSLRILQQLSSSHFEKHLHSSRDNLSCSKNWLAKIEEKV